MTSNTLIRRLSSFCTAQGLCSSTVMSYWCGAGAPGLGSLHSGLGSGLLQGPLPLPQAPLLPQSLLQSPVGMNMHMAMYNMLLLQNPQLRAQLPALAGSLGGDPLRPKSDVLYRRPHLRWLLGLRQAFASPLCCNMALDVAPSVTSTCLLHFRV